MKNLTLAIVFVFLLVLFTFVPAVSGQGKTDEKRPVEWQRFKSQNGEFSIEMPSDAVYFYDKDGFKMTPQSQSFEFTEVQKLSAAAEKTVMSVDIYQVNKVKGCLKQLMENDDLKGNETEEKLPDFTVKLVEQTSHIMPRDKTSVNISFITKYIASKKYIYVVTVANRGSKSAEAERFLSSLRIGGDKAGQTDTENSVDISSLKPLTISDIASEAIGERIERPPVPAVPIGTVPAENQASILILTKPRPTYSNQARKEGVGGTIRLRLTFSENGSISKAVFLTALPAGLNRNSFFTALKMRFLPAEKDGVFDTVTKVVEFGFAIY